MIRIENLSLQAGAFQMQDVNLHVEPGEYFVLLGPTGSGKTLLVSCICGLRLPTGGSIRIDGRDVTALEPRKRSVGYVPQDGALFPHMTVARNVTFALRVRGQAHRDALTDSAPIIEMLGIEPLLNRTVHALSGGERQKVALARALVMRPKVLLLDEPVSALDEPTRQATCRDLVRAQSELGISTIHICHNRDEAHSVADRVGIMHAGRLVQTGTLADLMQSPATEAVARLLGAENIFTGAATPNGTGACIAVGEHRICTTQPCNGRVTLMIRPESLRIVPAGAPDALSAEVRRVSARGPYVRLDLETAVGVLVVFTPPGGADGLEVGGRCHVAFPPDAVRVIEDGAL
jgi:ABC-type Fe3+/spermidine/putrescine transport system ATPase subunit